MAKLSSVQDENVAPSKAVLGKNMKQTKIFDSDNEDDFSFGGGGGGGSDDSDFEEVVSTKKRKPAAKAAPGTTAPKRIKKVNTTAASKKKSSALQVIDSNSVVDVVNDVATGSGSATPEPSGDGAKSAGKKSASDQYQKLSQLEHVLKRPDTYVGSVEHTETKMWVFDQETQSMKYKDVTICPGLFKIFDEILVNAADNKIRDPSMDTLNVEIDEEKNTISVYNNGRGIPIEIHEKEKIYIPELIFGNLLTSSNYDDDEKKVTGGRNGYGAKVSTRGASNGSGRSPAAGGK